MDEQFIDKFFNEGILRISSFDYFRKYPDEVRGDKSEGGGGITGVGSGGNFQFNVMTNIGENGYLLSASLDEAEDIQREFKTDSYFVIKDPLNFSAAVSNAILGVKETFVGFCNYQPHRIICKEIPGLSVEDFTDDKGSFIIGSHRMSERISQLVGNGIDLMFLKEQKYQHQAEFRFVWTINTNFFQMQDYIDISCKEAVLYCERRSS